MEDKLADNTIRKKVNEFYLLGASIIVYLYFLFAKSFTISESFIVAYQFYVFLRFINNVGYTICFFDFLIFYSAMDTLLMPLIGYRIFNASNQIARIWGWYMRVPQEVYFNFLIPANLALFLGLKLLTFKYKTQHFKEFLQQLAEKGRDKGKVGIALTIIGFLFSFLANIQSSLAFVFYLLSMLKYVGPFYIYFSELRFRNKIFYLSIVIYLLQSIFQGMFGEFVMYLVLSLIVVSIKYNFRFLNKLVVFLAGLFLVFVLQSIKGNYRLITWQGRQMYDLSLESSSKIEIFGSLIWRRLGNIEQLFDDRLVFSIYTRMNQGFLISKTMNYVPRVKPYAEGETIGRSLAAIVVPRILWPDKPEAGGRDNLQRFVGITQRLGYSMNIGPYGEAYGNFGPQYGVVFIFVYGLFLSYLLRLLLENSKRRPTLLLWFPLLLFSTLTVETDILSTLNSLIKGALFVVIIFWGAKRFFGVNL